MALRAASLSIFKTYWRPQLSRTFLTKQLIEPRSVPIPFHRLLKHSFSTETASKESSETVQPKETEEETEETKEHQGETKADAKLKEEIPAEEKKLSPEQEIKQLQETIKKKDEQVKEKHEQVLRAWAEVDNAHKITKKQIEKNNLYASSGFALAILEVADNLRLALDNISPQAQQEDPQSPFKKLYEGVEMTDKVLHKILEQQGVTKMSVKGIKFDPNLHQALFEVQDTTQEPGTVHTILKDGYKMKDRVLRPAQVGVVKKVPKAETPKEQPKA